MCTCRSLNHVPKQSRPSGEANFVEDCPDDEALVAQMAEDGDEDAIFVSEYEGQILDYVQEMPELSECFTAYTAARARLRERARSRSRGFWPPSNKGRGKSKGGGGALHLEAWA